MIPYFTFNVIPIGPLHIQVWGLMVASGMLLSIWFGSREARRRGIDAGIFVDFATTIMVGALIGARLFHVAVYDPHTYIADPIRVLRLWEGGFSSVGGFLGAAVAALWFSRRHKISFRDYGDVACLALPLGDGIGRIGCFLIHDHPGVLSNSFLAVRFPDGGRLDHGLLLSLLGFAMFAVFLAINRSKKWGTLTYKAFLPLFMVFYGGVRFTLDFFRATDLATVDVRYLHLTPAQYVCLLMIAAGAWMLFRDFRRHAVRG